jgi:single-stranded-DNA-specific exonuclease
MRTWHELENVDVPAELQAVLGGHPLVLQTLVRRGFGDLSRARAFLDPELYSPCAPGELPDLDKAITRLEKAIQRGERICVWGDFDVDGQTSTSLLVSALKELGAEVNFHIPVRAKESHGVNLPWLKKIIDAGAELVLTCDTGIRAHEAAVFARERGIDMIISDHHDLPDVLPEAYAVVNPKRLPAEHSLATLPGVGVAYKLAEELYRRRRYSETSSQFLDLLALGVVADVANQHGDVRYLLQLGLIALRQTTRPGLLEMMKQANVKPENLTEEHIGFLLAPRLNALGRLSDANLSVDFFTTRDATRASVLAVQLEGLNEERKLLTSQVFQAALAQIEADPTLLQTPVLVLAHPAWEAGVLGIVASRLVEHYGKPAILLTAPGGKNAHGSARSVEGINITDAIAAQNEMLASFGGHPMAAGLAFNPGEDIFERIAQFRRNLAKTVLQKVGENPPQEKLVIDGRLPLSELNLELVADVERLAPFGAGNPALTLVAQGMNLAKSNPLGKNEEHLLLEVADKNKNSYRVIWWQGTGWPPPQGSFDLAYRARATDFGGLHQVQIEWVEAHPTEAETITILTEKKVRVIDLRGVAQPHQRIRLLHSELPELQVWIEGEQLADTPGTDRLSLIPAATLAIWTTPPGSAELRTVMAHVKPTVVYLFGIDPDTDHAPVFLEHLAGLVKYALNARDGQIRLSLLAAATAQREASVQAGLEWLQGKGTISILSQEGDQVWFGKGGGVSQGDPSALNARLKAVLEESAAFRRYFKMAEKDSLLGYA